MNTLIISGVYIEAIGFILVIIMTSITVEDSLLIDLKLLKRVLGTKSMTETIRALLIARGYNQEWFEYMTKTLETEGIA